jgi:hypothetical protein
MPEVDSGVTPHCTKARCWRSTAFGKTREAKATARTASQGLGLSYMTRAKTKVFNCNSTCLAHFLFSTPACIHQTLFQRQKMTDKHWDASGLSEVESKWPQISNDIMHALGLTPTKSEDFKRLDSLYRRCLMCVPGLQEKEFDFGDLHKCVLAAIQMIEHRWPNVNPIGVRAALEERLLLNDDLVARAVNIAVCLWLGVDCVGPKHGMPKSWPDIDSIHHFVLGRRFDDPTETSIGDPISRFPPKFRAARLEDLSGISIESTYYLDQHLRFNEDTRTLKVFMDVVWLQSMCKRFRENRDAPQEGSTSCSSPSEQTSPMKQSPDCDAHARSLANEKRISLESGSCGIM